MSRSSKGEDLFVTVVVGIVLSILSIALYTGIFWVGWNLCDIHTAMGVETPADLTQLLIAAITADWLKSNTIRSTS